MKPPWRSVKWKTLFPVSWPATLVTAAILAGVIVLCLVLQAVSDGNQHVPLLFVLAALLVSLTTEGYFYGLFASVVGVIGVNYIFTYPYFSLNFKLAGYPLTFLIMLAVSMVTCTLTARLKQQEKLRTETEKEKIRANLLRAISHDLRTPLTSIEGSVAAILENGDSLDEEQKRALLTESRNSARWLIRMVENLLSITRMGADPSGASIRKEPELVEEIVGEAVGNFRKKHPQLRVQVKVPEEPLLVPMDAMLIEQVLLNLLENALLHGKGARTVQVHVRKEPGQAVFLVQDDGCGIDPRRLPTLLEGYLSEARQPQNNDRKQSLGIGLSVCSSIVAAHGGVLTGRNRRDGPGAEFFFTLPLEKERS